MRVVSLLPSATEMLFALGIEPVGVSHECDHPPAVSELPELTRPRIDPAASSADIDQQVQDARETGGVYAIDRERLAALDPDFIVSQGHCEVCAVDDTALRRVVDDLHLDAEIVTSDPHSLADVFADIERLGRILGRSDRAREVRSDLESRVEAVVQATTGNIAESDRTRPRVAVLDWLDPVMVAGHWIPEMVERVGGAYGLAARGEASRPHEWETIREYDPEILFAAPCGFGLDQIRENATDLTERVGWTDLTAVSTDRVYAVDGNHYVNRPGPRLVETLAALASAIHPGSVEPLADAVEPVPLVGEHTAPSD